MSMVAKYYDSWTDWDFIIGEYHDGMSVSASRFEHLHFLNLLNGGSLTVAAHDPVSGGWTKWVKFPGMLLKTWVDAYRTSHCSVVPLYDVHRSTLPFEVVVESDYVCGDCAAAKKAKEKSVVGCPDCYELNYGAAKLIGAILEKKGFSPLYYYSGNKSVHIHLYMDFRSFKGVDMFLQNQVMEKFKHKGRFVKVFMEWLRQKIISCWDLKAREFDTDLIRCSHLIRSELSRNKKGFKTFLGYSYKDLSFIPRVCNEKNRIYPELGMFRWSRPEFPQDLLEEFLADQDVKHRIDSVRRREFGLRRWLPKEDDTKLRSCIKLILSDNFLEVGDGFHRAMFILANELKKVYGPDEARIILNDWNVRMGSPIKESEIEYRVLSKEYSLSRRYVGEFLRSVGLELPD